MKQIQINAYFESLLENPSGVRSLADLITFNDAHPELEKPEGFSDQTRFVRGFILFLMHGFISLHVQIN